MRDKHAAGEPPTELWDALAEKGYLGVNMPEECGGGGLGMSGLAAVGEEISAAGCSLLLIVVSPAIVGSILARHGTDAQKDALAARHRRRARPRSPSRSPSPTPAPTRTTSPPRCERASGGYVLNGQKTYISGVEDADAVLVVARSRARRRPARPAARCASSTSTRRASRATRSRCRCIGADKQWTLFFDDVELAEERLIGGEGGGLGARLRRPQPGADHGRRRGLRRRPARAREGGRLRPRARPSGARRSAPTRASRHPLARRRSSSSWRA